MNYCTEAPFIQTLCPTLVLGPGSINQAHQPDEYLETRFIKPTRELITQVVHHFCWPKACGSRPFPGGTVILVTFPKGNAYPSDV